MFYSVRGVVGIGRCVASEGALEALKGSKESYFPYLRRHVQGDPGEVSNADLKENGYSVSAGDSEISVFSLKSGVEIAIVSNLEREWTMILRKSDDEEEKR